MRPRLANQPEGPLCIFRNLMSETVNQYTVGTDFIGATVLQAMIEAIT
jgi:hypothetical protein